MYCVLLWRSYHPIYGENLNILFTTYLWCRWLLTWVLRNIQFWQRVASVVSSGFFVSFEGRLGPCSEFATINRPHLSNDGYGPPWILISGTAIKLVCSIDRRDDADNEGRRLILQLWGENSGRERKISNFTILSIVFRNVASWIQLEGAVSVIERGGECFSPSYAQWGIQIDESLIATRWRQSR